MSLEQLIVPESKEFLLKMLKGHRHQPEQLLIVKSQTIGAKKQTMIVTECNWV